MTNNLQTVKIGFIPLVDCALLAITKEKGFGAEHGIDLDLHKEVSWANIRDKVYLGYLDGAQMLAGMPLAANLSLMPNSSDIIAPFVLGRNGNAITVSHALYEEMVAEGGELLDELDLVKTGAALKAVIEKRKQTGKSRLRFAMVFPFSCHNYHLRYWMAACGIDPDVDVHLEVIPPAFMDENLEQGYIDGFCVGEPWNSLAVAQDLGVIIASTAQIWSQSPEKLLGMRKDWVERNSALFTGLMKALAQAANWAAETSHQEEIAEILSEHQYLDVPAEIILKALSGNLCLKKGNAPVFIKDFMALAGQGANCPHPQEGVWILQQMERWKQIKPPFDAQLALESAFSRTLYGEVLGLEEGEEQGLRLFDFA
ncbi:CmpA/NrtA family ABC transporter substrate-binding protein [Terasakiella sp. SH-1]|uniref:CmpA/NrtA family ABC transporter substrate-binding protein n=1 Tax=Terasakiella sp. SH-1 TaxID=2560057 RepID=UPI0010731BCA|nr:CmpA/NrtA family ABC transporter substrate-binding protein [Terasakiella sp. SH-1]